MGVVESVLAVWLTVFAVAFMTGHGKEFAKWSWGFITRPFRSFWGHYGNYVLFLLLGALIGFCYAPAIRSLLVGP